MPEKAAIAIVGAAGYAGGEAASILLRHPGAEPCAIFGSAGGSAKQRTRLDTLFPHLRNQTNLTVQPADPEAIAAASPDAVFLATPHEASARLAPVLLDAGLRVLDLSAAFRLPDPALYPKHYSFAHEDHTHLASAVYGLPELNRDRLPDARLIAVPGCYPTSAILPLAPLIRAGAVRADTPPIIDSVSGVSGAGRTPSPTTHFCEVSLRPYGVWTHRHTPEISIHAGANVIFTPHLGPYDRGIVSTIHVQLAQGWTGDRARETLLNAYEAEPFVRLLPAGEWPSVAGVRGTNCCDIALAADDQQQHLIICSAIDNLVKGAAGQAVQCLNALLRLPETTGLEGRIA